MENIHKENNEEKLLKIKEYGYKIAHVIREKDNTYTQPEF